MSESRSTAGGAPAGACGVTGCIFAPNFDSDEAQSRLRDPVYICVAHIFALQQQVVNLPAELSYLQAHLSTLQLPIPPQPLPPPPTFSISDQPSASNLLDLSALFHPLEPYSTSPMSLEINEYGPHYESGSVEALEEEEPLYNRKEEIDKQVPLPLAPTTSAQDEPMEEDGSKQQQTAQEENLDKILAELCEAPGPSSERVYAPTQPEVAEAEEEENGGDAVESAVAKKKKKKEKEKAKKATTAAAAAAVPAEEVAKEDKEEDPKEKKPMDNKKRPKHVREMQEVLARRRELEEQQKRVEERKRKEVEEWLRQEQLEREAEEKKRRKKEREKEKKLEGKPITSKQKEARRLDAKRRQFAGETSGFRVGGEEETEKKNRPVYGNNKAKPKARVIEKVEEGQQEEMEQAKDYGVPETESQSQFGEEEDVQGGKHEIEEPQPMEEEDEDDYEWDAKSLDDVNVNLNTNAFVDEDAEEEAKAAGKKISSSIDSQANSSVVVVKPAIKKVVVAPSVSAKTGEDKGNDNNGVVSENDAKGKKEDARSTESKASPKKSGSDLRSPICCILGHVDTGKTKLLDCIRRTNVQEGEAGGITQQIGATYFPAENIRERTKELKADATLKVPGLLVIDTPGHESFTNLRSRGSSLCDIAILVVDIMHGLEQQTIESLNLLKSRNTEFIVALNKVDRLYGWKTSPNAPMIKSIRLQSKDVRNEYERRVNDVITQFKEQGLNTALYYKNKEMGEAYNIVPTSAITGEGIPDLLLLVIQWAQKTMEDKLTYVDKVEGTVLEVKVIEGLGTTIDVILVNGVLHEGDQIVVCGMQGPIETHIRALLMPHPMKELRVKGAYQHHKEIKAVQGVKISAQDLDHAVAGTPLYVVGPDDNIIDIKEAAMEDMKGDNNRIDTSREGVYVQASTLGSLEALTEYLKSPDVEIPFFGFNIGPVHKKDVERAGMMVERRKEYAAILAFDVKVTSEARECAAATGVTIFEADIIYHLFDQFKGYIDNLKEEKKKESADEVVFPCVLKIIPNCIFNKKDPIVLGVSVLEGIVKVGTPICIPSRDFIDIGRIQSIENNHKQVENASMGQPVAIKIVGTNPEEQKKMLGRHFDIDDELVSHLSRKSIDILKASYRDKLSRGEWDLVRKLKKKLKIP